MDMSDSTEAFCLFCYKSFIKSKSEDGKGNGAVQSLEDEQSKGLQSRFFRLLNRHLQENKTSSLTKLKLKEFELENVLLQCPDCSSLLQSYCDYFEEIEVLKLKLNWRLGMLAKIVSCSEKVKSRRTCFEQKIRKRFQGFEDENEAFPQDLLQSVKRLRKELVQKCKRILRSSAPQVILKKCTEPRILKLEERREMDQRNSSSILLSILSGSGYFGRDRIEENYVPHQKRVKIENGQHSSPVLSTSLIQSTPNANAKIKDRPEPVTTSVEGDTASLDKVDDETKAWIEPRTSEKSDLKLKGDDDDDDDARSRWCVEGSLAAAIVTEEIPVVITSSGLEANKVQSIPHPEINLNGIVTPNRDEVMQKEFNKAQGQQSPVQLQEVDEPVDEEFAEAEVIDSDSSKPVLGEVEHRPDTIMFEEHFEGPLLPFADAKIENQEHCSEEEETRVPEEAVQDKGRKSSNAKLNESKACVEPEEQSEAESTARRFSLRTRHKCPKCSVGFTSASNLKLHLGYCGEPESTLDKDSNDENINGDDDYDELGEGDNCSEDDNGDEDAAISASDSSHLSEAESDAGSDDEGKRDSGRKRKLTTPSALPKQGKYEFFETKLNCEVEDCKFYFYKQQDLDNHSKLHGEFKCAFCDVTKTYAPDLSVHELSHKVKLELGRDGLVKDKQSVQCPRCTSEVQFVYFTAYNKHYLEAHLDLTPSVHTCPVCECAFRVNENTIKSELMVHFRANHDLECVPETEVKRCHHDGCSAYFLTYSQLGRHRLAVHIEGGKDNCKGPFICDICDESFITKQSFMKHRVNFHKVGLPVPCDDPSCNERFENELYMNRHLAFRHRSSSEDDSVKRRPTLAYTRKCVCLVCGYLFRTASKLNQHLDRAHPQFKAEAEIEAKFGQNRSRIPCLVCKVPLKIGGGSGGSTAFNMIKQHFKAFHKLKGLDLSSPSVLKCNVGDCKAYFLRHAQLRVHQKRSHFDGKYKCATCDVSRRSPYELKKHRVTAHMVELNFACPHEGCYERCETQADLDYHVDLAHGDPSKGKNGSRKLQDLVCDTCGKRCKELGAFKSHLRIHAPKEPRKVICPVCGKAFRNKTYLQTHLLRHAGPESWQFACETCNKKCITKQRLEEHQNVHSEVKPFTCEHCGLKYAHRHNLRDHLKDKHSVILESAQRGRKKTTIVMDD